MICRKKVFELKQRAIREALRNLNDAWARGEIKFRPRVSEIEDSYHTKRSTHQNIDGSIG